MKKITTKINFLKLRVLLFGVSLLLWNCEKGEFSNEEVVLPQYRSPIESMEIVSLSDINPAIKNTVINSESHFVRKSQKYISYSLNDIIKIVDTLQNTKFSIRFKLNNQPENVIYNLIIGMRNDDSTIVPYVMKYTINNLSEMTNNDGHDAFPESNHLRATAIDISRINGTRIVNLGNNSQVSSLQNAFDNYHGIRENFGPNFRHKTFQNGNKDNNFSVSAHDDHIHISIQSNTNCN